MKRINALIMATLSTGVLNLTENPTLANPILQRFCQGVIAGAQVTGDFSTIPEDCYPFLPYQSNPDNLSPAKDIDDDMERQNRRVDQIERQDQINDAILQNAPGVCLNCDSDSD